MSNKKRDVVSKCRKGIKKRINSYERKGEIFWQVKLILRPAAKLPSKFEFSMV